MDVTTITCPICQLGQPLVQARPIANPYDLEVNCKRCGRFEVVHPELLNPLYLRQAGLQFPSPRFLADKRSDPNDRQEGEKLLRACLSIYTRECTERGIPGVPIISHEWDKLERLAETYANTPIASKPGKLLRLLEKRTGFPGQRVRLDPELDYPAVHAVNAEELGFYLQALQEDGSLQYENTPKAGEHKLTTFVKITLDGWQRLASSGVRSRTAFVAMHFDVSLNSAFSEGIEPAVREAGYEPMRVDKVHHNEKICDRIVSEIRRSRFLIADVTDQRQGVYFEAGFAMGLGLPVIWSCREDNQENIHFDTRQYNHILWKEPADLREKLRDRIIATIGLVR